MYDYNPFDKPIDALQSEDLGILRGVNEGWYVEYKQDFPEPRKMAKSLAALANQYGGWLIFGVACPSGKLAPEAFPGIAQSAEQKALEALRNASKDSVNPEVFFESKAVRGPASDLGLPEGRTILIVRVPQGPDPPYVHNDGRIYRRVADSSDPVSERDPSALQRLMDRRHRARDKLADFVLT